ncbi:DUF1553 domain-containing protein [Fulvivirgaceae bacterium BMA12]|uniref:DUF1553 domain-containing protein n=1 Tax=Agaribacillus aureus TaxID=3051825 RepID=A0ABT8L8S8_9BACT|nr:DUF1553 domain-containing protein [Fulvivirgaceae bacterium BMA12]
MNILFRLNLLASFLVIVVLLLLTTSCQEKKIDFNADVRPILNKNCISCHGGVKQSGGFGLIFRENALGETKNGKIGIVPGHPEKSEMIARINHKNPEMRMPQERDPLKQEEIDILTKWIEQGAEWKEHWAYLAPEEPEIPEDNTGWGTNEIDNFILQKLEENDLSPSGEADKHDLVRRIYLDLTGLPPSTQQVADFVNDTSENAYENLVDELLQSQKYGEHWASMWLDLARYADSKGYEKDGTRNIWKYRDWVIKAFNDDKPFDQFTIEQLAGDLLPNPTVDQLVATAFHRNTLNNDEGGTDNEEYRVSSVIDRVNTTWEVWQSTTISCVQCHSHPYDPILQEEYFSSFAFFNNTADWDINSEEPLLKELHEVDQDKLDKIKNWIADRSGAPVSNKWERFVLTGEPKLRPEDFDAVENVVHQNRSGQDYMRVFKGAYINIQDVVLKDVDRIYFEYRQRTKSKGTLTIRTDSLTGPVIGKASLAETGSFKTIPIPLTTTAEIANLYFEFQSGAENYSCDIDGFLLGQKLPGEKDREYEDMYAEIDEILNAPYKHSTPVMVEKPEDHSRQTNVFIRGNWMVKGDPVSAGIPKLFDGGDLAFRNRLDMANWLVSKENPLSGRVIVNRFWAKIFGRGIVATVEDFGTLGDYPSHPALLDWLALRFTGEWKWSTKKLLKAIVMSSTYRQTSRVAKEAEEKDPDNRWLSKAPRVRLSAEQIRDQALAVSGLLSEKMYGPSVKPYQPEGIWTIPYSSEKWITSEGEDAYRRGLYTYLRRSSPYPSFVTFDASQRELCLSRRINTNTPLQALVTLNDPVYLEAARSLAGQIIQVAGGKKEKVETAYQRAMGKMPTTEKAEILIKLLDDTETYYQEHQEEAFELAKSENLELASLTVMANALMNMDEFIVKN